MTKIESFANAGGSLEPLELQSPTAQVVLCAGAAFAGAFVGITVNYALDKAVDWYAAHHGGGHFSLVGDGEVPVGQFSGDELLELAARF